MRRRSTAFALVLTALAVIAACGSPPGPTEEEAQVGDYLDTRVTTTLPGTETVPGSDTTVSPLTTAPSAAAPGGPSGPRTTIDIGENPPPTVQSDDPVEIAAYGQPGSAAGMILQSVDAPKLVIELINQANAEFVQQALQRMLSDVRQFSGKQPEIVRTTTPNGDPAKEWTPGELRSFVDENGRRRSGGDTFVMHLLAARGRFQPSAGGTTLGAAIRADTFVYLQDTGIALDDKQMRALYVHELGHLLGLVDLYLQRNRHDTAFDPEKRGHSKNQRSVMYYAVQPGLNLGTPFDSTSDQFDSEDLRDLQLIKAGAPPGSNPTV